MRLLLVDDHQMMRDCLRELLRRHDGFEVVAEASDGIEAVVMARQHKPDVVLMDVLMPNLGGIEATRQILSDRAGVNVLALSMSSQEQHVIAMLEAGARGYLLKSAGAEELVQAVLTVSRSQTYVSQAIAEIVVKRFAKPGAPGRQNRGGELTPRERSVVQLLAAGKTSREIAAQLAIAHSTVETNRRQIMKKLDVRGVAQITKYALRVGLATEGALK